MNTSRKRSFSRFDLASAYALVGITALHDWNLQTAMRPASDFLQQRLQRLEAFDTKLTEGARLLIVDALLEEAIQTYTKVRIFKETTLTGEDASGMVDYLVAPRLDLPTTPFLCIVEAKKDDFEKGLAQCLVELHTCAQINAKKKKTQELFGIVTNAEGWKFYRRDPTGAFYETPLHALTHLQQLLGILDYVFARCEENLNATL